MGEPIFTERLTMHLNGGSKFSVLEYAVHVDGRRTDVKHIRRTGGRPDYLITADAFWCPACGAELDRLASPGADWRAWLLEHARDHAPDAGSNDHTEEQSGTSPTLPRR